jgi:hypothetical protein
LPSAPIEKIPPLSDSKPEEVTPNKRLWAGRNWEDKNVKIKKNNPTNLLTTIKELKCYAIFEKRPDMRNE